MYVFGFVADHSGLRHELSSLARTLAGYSNRAV
jgi:hypothetical protein